MKPSDFENLHLSENPKQARAERDALVHDMRKQGLTLREIGERVLLSRERVRHILMNPPAK